jgi:hypothetical protein
VALPNIVKLPLAQDHTPQRRGTPYTLMSASSPNLTTSAAQATASPLSDKPPANCTYARAVKDFMAKGPGQLSLEKGDIVYVTDKYKTSWWKGCLKRQMSNSGLFPEGKLCIYEVNI